MSPAYCRSSAIIICCICVISSFSSNSRAFSFSCKAFRIWQKVKMLLAKILLARSKGLFIKSQKKASRIWRMRLRQQSKWRWLKLNMNVETNPLRILYNRYEYGDCLVTQILVTLSQIFHLWSDVKQQGSELETSLHIHICYIYLF